MASLETMSRPSLPLVLVVVFALSGFSGLIYESIWTHYLKLFLGHAAYAQTLVLAIFMGGLAVGSWLCSRWSSRWNNLLRGYAVTEGVIGVGALGFHLVFDGVEHFAYTTILPALHTPSAITMHVGLPLLGLQHLIVSATAQHRVGTRPDRSEPRAVKRRPKPSPLLRVPRQQARARLTQAA